MFFVETLENVDNILPTPQVTLTPTQVTLNIFICGLLDTFVVVVFPETICPALKPFYFYLVELD